MFRLSLKWLLGALLAGAACTAGNYDVAPCDPKVATLSQDVCNRLNPNPPDPTVCDLYQCDRETSTCKLAKRDFDRDGDADQMCGGTDCNDFDPTLNGVNSTCQCNGTPTAKTCMVGTGVCQRTSEYVCLGGNLYCTKPGTPAIDYMAAADPSTKSWDWNCDGTLELGCKDPISGQTSECPAANCDAVLQETVGSSNDSACQTFCSRISDKKDPRCEQNFANFVICDAGCGKSVLTCHCTPNSNVFNPAACTRYLTVAGNSNMGSVLSQILCR